jgi:hypothetical protein
MNHALESASRTGIGNFQCLHRLRLHGLPQWRGLIRGNGLNGTTAAPLGAGFTEGALGGSMRVKISWDFRQFDRWPITSV